MIDYRGSFTIDSVITSIDFSEFKEGCEEAEDCEIDELVISAYLNDLPISNYLKSVMVEDYGDTICFTGQDDSSEVGD